MWWKDGRVNVVERWKGECIDGWTGGCVGGRVHGRVFGSPGAHVPNGSD